MNTKEKCSEGPGDDDYKDMNLSQESTSATLNGKNEPKRKAIQIRKRTQKQV